jgi:putative PEP-CTERM system histidine kinase
MNSGEFALMTVGYAAAALAYTGFAAYLCRTGYLGALRAPPTVSMLIAVVATALWGWLGVGALAMREPLLGKGSLLADILRYGGWYAFFLLSSRASAKGAAFAEDPAPRAPASALGGWMQAAAIGLLAVALVAQAGGALFPGDAASVAQLVLVSAMALPIFALTLLEQFYRNLSVDSRWNAKPLCLGLAGAFLFDFYFYSESVLFNRIDSDAMSVRAIIHALMLPLLVLSSLRRTAWVSRLRMSRKAVFHSATLLIAGAYLLLVSAIGYYLRYFGGDWGPALQLTLVFSALVALVLLAFSGTLRSRLRVSVSKHFFRYRYDYREEWLSFTAALSGKKTPKELGEQVVRGLADMLESPAGGLWLRRAGDTAGFRQSALWNLPEVHAAEPADSSLCHFMATSGWVVNLQEYREDADRYDGMQLPDWLAELPQAWLIVPLLLGEELIGFVLLDQPRTPVDVNWEVNDLLKTAARQAATFLAQMQATEALLEARKFDAFNRMSAFVVHDLKNIVTQLALMLENAKRLHANPEFQQDMLLTVENSLTKMRQMMLQLREGEAPAGGALGVDLSAIVERMRSLAQRQDRLLEVAIDEPVVTRGHDERLERVVGHVVQNALDATPRDRRVWIRLGRASGQARVEVGDTGAGMSEAFVRDRLFRPFQTTKQAGMGIGAYESFQYVQELGGKIQVDSQLGQGTRVVILLPLLETRTEPALAGTETR